MPRCLIHDDRELDPKLLEEHHKQPTSYGGPDTEENRCWLCPSCHDAVHRISHSFYARRIGEGRDLIDQYLPNQPARRERLEQLCRIVSDAKRGHLRTGDIPEAAEATEDVVKMTIELPSWVHHRLKTATMGAGLYKSVEAILTQHALAATKASGAQQPITEASVDEIEPAQDFPLIDLTRPE
jgi:hypothetical protein